ncbi:ATP-binding protein [Marinomonas sp. C2222]|uniref:histidine kinase n=1 Tax=Marinomonas sargassi TaxID=2984494 RepID=A0ABT2YN58_9GAMM|nr:ATP-binding protein [Marinomonas sargassi]MCV2401325.1 ATP-binding protein [Marinomonas sargassi]
MDLIAEFNQQEHDQVVIDCFFELWHYSADFMFIMAVEENGEFSLFDNNPASKQVMGLPLDTQIHRMNIRETWGDTIVEGLYDTYRKAINARKPISIIQNATKLDKEICVDTLLVPIFNAENEAIYVCGVSRDITKIKDAESIAIEANEKLREYSEALQSINTDLDRNVKERTKELETAKHLVEESLKAKSSFVARMSHEIRTPINGILGLSHLALKTPLNDEQQDYINKILASGEVLLSLINNVLDFSKIEAGEMRVEQVPFSLKNTVDHAIAMNSLHIEEKMLMVTVDISPTLPELILGDPLRTQQILLNLVTNAVKFTHHGGISIRLYPEKNHSQQYALRCDVTDTGIGLPKEFSENLFKPFQQADDSVTRKYGGTGLGLTISHQLCELMGGKIWVNSELGQGSTFSFIIPVEPIDDTPLKTNETTESITKAPNLFDFKVLIVEDNIINKKVIQGYLEETKLQLSVAENGEEAIKKIYSEEYDLVLMDIQMPVMDGLTATRIIRQSPSYKDLPIIAMTAHVSKEAREQSLNAGMNDHLDKPINKSELYKTLQQHLNTKKLNRGSNPDTDNKGHDEASYEKILSKLKTIDTLDIEKAISNLNGKQDLYIELVSAFYIKYQCFSVNENSDIVSMIRLLEANSMHVGDFRLAALCTTFIQSNDESANELAVIEGEIRSLVNKIEQSLIQTLPEKDNEFCSHLLAKKLESITPLLKNSDFFVENYFSLLRKMAKGTEYALDVEHLIYNVKNVEFEVAEELSSHLITELQGKTNGNRATSTRH